MGSLLSSWVGKNDDCSKGQETEAQRPHSQAWREDRGEPGPRPGGFAWSYKHPEAPSALWKFLFLHRYILLFEYLLCFLLKT